MVHLAFPRVLINKFAQFSVVKSRVAQGKRAVGYYPTEVRRSKLRSANNLQFIKFNTCLTGLLITQYQ
jgi:hypothetical protein